MKCIIVMFVMLCTLAECAERIPAEDGDLGHPDNGKYTSRVTCKRKLCEDHLVASLTAGNRKPVEWKRQRSAELPPEQAFVNECCAKLSLLVLDKEQACCRAETFYGDTLFGEVPAPVSTPEKEESPVCERRAGKGR